MNDTESIDFYSEEKLYRAVPDNPNMIRNDGTVTSAIFKDSKGASVDRQMRRENSEAVRFLKSNKSEAKLIVSVNYKQCTNSDIDVKVVYKPITENKYHSEIHRDDSFPELRSSQAKKLSKLAIKETIE